MNKTLKNSLKKTNHSSFWAGSYFDRFDDLQTSDSRRLYQLAKGKRAIANFVTIATGHKVPVTFNSRGDSYTNGKTVVIGAEIDSPKEFDLAVGLALHEASHIVHTNFDVLVDLDIYIGFERFEKVENELGWRKYNTKRVVKDLLNVIEDRRLDFLSYQSAPGYREYYRKMYDKYFNSRVIDKALLSNEYTDEDLKSYLFRIINLHNTNTRVNALKYLPTIFKLIDLKNINRMKDTVEAMMVALDVFDVLIQALIETKPKPQPEEESNESEESDNSAENFDDTEGEEGIADYDLDEEETKAVAGSDENEDEDEEETKGDADSDEDSDGGGPDDGISDDETFGDSEGSGKESKLDAESPDSDREDDGTDGADSAGGTLDEGTETLSKRERKMLENAIERQNDFLNGDVKKKTLKKDEAKEIKDMEENGTVLGEAGESTRYNSAPVEVIVVNKVTKAMLEGVTKCPVISWKRNEMEKEVIQGMKLGRILAKKMQVRSESRTTVYNRQKVGRIDKRMISSLGFGNENVFTFNDVDEYKDANLHISIDASGSMSGEKWNNTITNVVAICTAVTMIPGLDIQVSIRSTTSLGNGYVPYVLMAYNSVNDKPYRIKEIFSNLRTAGSTPEGLCFEAIEKNFISQSTKKDSYFLNISDGMPMFSGVAKNGTRFGYSNEDAIDHTKEQVKKLRGRGIKVLSYYVSDSDSSWYGGGRGSEEQFRTMYGKDSEFIDITNIGQITKTINNLFMAK
jgi:hypothetical protein